jgi:hypothetical protein
MMRPILLLLLSLIAQEAPKLTGKPPVQSGPRERSAFFAFVDRDYIFTIEVVKPGVPLLNFVSMSDKENRVYAKDIRLNLGNRKATARLLSIETGEVKQPMSVTSLPIHPRSSFGLRIDGDFGDAKELYGATIRLGDQDLELVSLSNFEFENLVLKVNRLNLGSPDFREDWQVLKLEVMGSRSPARRRERN